MKNRLLLSALLVSAGVGMGGAGPADVETQVQQVKLRQVVEQTQPAYVFIGGGSGSIITSDGYVITNNHVAASKKEWVITTASGKTYKADVIGLAPMSDLALLRIRDTKGRLLPYIPLGDSDKLEVGEQVVAIGDPFLLGQRDHIPTVTLGIVSATGMSGPNAGEVVVTDAPTNPGNSGGPLINMAGQLVGINYAQMPSRFGIKINTGSGYAISSKQVTRFLDALKNAKGGQVNIGWMNGAKFQDQPQDQAIVRQVEPASPAGRAGLEVGDRILTVGPWQVLSAAQLFSLAARNPAGTSSTLTVQRGQEKRELTIALEQPERTGLGVVFESASTASLKIERVLPDSPADKAGIRPGDIVRAVAGVALPTRQSMAALLGRGRAGLKVPVALSRGDRQMAFTVELAGECELARLIKHASTQPEPAPAAATSHASTPIREPLPPEPPATAPDLPSVLPWTAPGSIETAEPSFTCHSLRR